MADKNGILACVKKNELCVIATSDNDGKPEAAVMAFAVNDSFELFMNTEAETRKLKNIMANSSVSVVVGGFKDDPSVQLDGAVRILSGEDAENAKTFVLGVHPEWESYFTSPSGQWLKITPRWARYSDFSQNPPEISEINL